MCVFALFPGIDVTVCYSWLGSTGRGLQVRGEDRMKWNKLSFDRPLKTGDVVGCGYIRDDGPDAGSSVYFTLNGHQQLHQLKDAPASLFPFVHLQKKVW